MRAIFQSGAFSRFDLGSHARSLSQAAYLSVAQRDALLGQIAQAEANIKIIADLVSWSNANDPQLRKFLGQDNTRFWTLGESLPALLPTVASVKERLSDVEGESWYVPTGTEDANLKQFLTAVSEMKKIVDIHKVSPPNFGPLVQPLPPSVTGQLQDVSSGPTTNEILIGAGLAVGLGILIAVIS